ncbi:phage portal protein [Thalassiella azotivora]
MIDVDEVRSPGWWLKTLSRELHNRRTGQGYSRLKLKLDNHVRPGLDELDGYLRGEPPLPHVAAGWREAMREFLRLARMNYALMSVQAVQHRMTPAGFGTAADDDRNGDQEAHKVFRGNALDLKFADVSEWMLGLADGYMIVGPPSESGGVPLITAEDPRETITAHDPATGRVLAGLKLFRDEWDSTDFAYLYLPGRCHVARRKSTTSMTTAPTFRLSPKSWEWDDRKGGADGQQLPPTLGGRVPVVRFRNARGVSEFEPHLAVLDRINDQIFDRVVISKYQAFRQRGIKGLPDRDEKTGEEIDYSEAFLADPGGMWRLPAGAEVWESALGDMQGIRSAIKDDVESFAAVTFTPLHYITPDAAQGSAEGASTMREGHLFRVKDRRRRADAALAEVMSLAFAWTGDQQRADVHKIRTIWEPAEQYSLTERMSAAAQAKAAGLPQASIYTDVMGYGPADLVRIERERATDLLFMPPGQPPAATPVVPGG